jgi:DivIVA domain-containing protein
MAKEKNLTAIEVYDKDFEVQENGYSPEEVDGFLDLIIEDYQTYDEEIKELGRVLMRYEDKINSLQTALSRSEEEKRQIAAENENLNKQLADANEKHEAAKQALEEAQTAAAEAAPAEAEESEEATLLITPESSAPAKTLEERVEALERAVFHTSN